MLHQTTSTSVSSRSNRTFMELKYERVTSQSVVDTSSNRTFMELKFA